MLIASGTTSNASTKLNLYHRKSGLTTSPGKTEAFEIVWAFSIQ